MHVIWHHHKFTLAYFDMSITGRQLVPYLRYHLPGCIQLHFSINNLAEQAFAAMRTNGYEIGTRPGIIVTLEPRGTPVMFIGIKLHVTNGVESSPKGHARWHG